VVRGAGGGAGLEQPPGALDQHGLRVAPGLAVRGVDDDVHAVERSRQALTRAQVDAMLRRGAREHAHRVPAAAQLDDHLAAEGPGAACDRDVHGPRAR
jgi:hypothetical protein